jgi:hypothetical protein
MQKPGILASFNSRISPNLPIKSRIFFLAMLSSPIHQKYSTPRIHLHTLETIESANKKTTLLLLSLSSTYTVLSFLFIAEQILSTPIPTPKTNTNQTRTRKENALFNPINYISDPKKNSYSRRCCAPVPLSNHIYILTFSFFENLPPPPPPKPSHSEYLCM